jgi:hypothetical protein
LLASHCSLSPDASGSGCRFRSPCKLETRIGEADPAFGRAGRKPQGKTLSFEPARVRGETAAIPQAIENHFPLARKAAQDQHRF